MADVSLTTREVFGADYSATEIDARSLAAGGAAHKGKHRAHWRREDGAMKLDHDIWKLDA